MGEGLLSPHTNSLHLLGSEMAQQWGLFCCCTLRNNCLKMGIRRCLQNTANYCLHFKNGNMPAEHIQTSSDQRITQSQHEIQGHIAVLSTHSVWNPPCYSDQQITQSQHEIQGHAVVLSNHSAWNPPCYSSPTAGSEGKLLMAMQLYKSWTQKMLKQKSKTGKRRHRSNLTNSYAHFYYMLG